MDLASYYRQHARECEVAFRRSTPDRPVALPALVYARVHKNQPALREMLDRASEPVRRRYEEMLGAGEEGGG